MACSTHIKMRSSRKTMETDATSVRALGVGEVQTMR